MLELGSSATPSRSMLSRSGHFPSVSLLKPFPTLEEKVSPDLLPWSRSSFPGGDDWASGGPALCRRRAHPPGMPRPPLLFPCAVRDRAPQTLAKLSVFGSESSYNILSYLLTWISFARTRIIGCTCVHPCLMLGPPLPAANARVRILVVMQCAMHLRFLDWYFSAMVLLVDVRHGTPPHRHNCT